MPRLQPYDSHKLKSLAWTLQLRLKSLLFSRLLFRIYLHCGPASIAALQNQIRACSGAAGHSGRQLWSGTSVVIRLANNGRPLPSSRYGVKDGYNGNVVNAYGFMEWTSRDFQSYTPYNRNERRNKLYPPTALSGRAKVWRGALLALRQAAWVWCSRARSIRVGQCHRSGP